MLEITNKENNVIISFFIMDTGIGIALTASALIEDQQQAANADMVNFISKSFKSEELSQKTLKYI